MLKREFLPCIYTADLAFYVMRVKRPEPNPLATDGLYTGRIAVSDRSV